MSEEANEPAVTARDKFFVIGDDDTVLGFRYAGLRGQAVSDEHQARLALQQAIRADVPIVIITDVAAQMIQDDVNEIRFEARTPIIVEVPTRSGPVEGRPSLMELIREAVGISV